MKKILIFLLLIITLVYPFIIYFGLSHLSVKYIAILLIGIFALRFLLTRSKEKTVSSFIPIALCLAGIGIGIVGAISSSVLAIKLYPVIVSLVLLTVFSYSLYYPPTIIEYFARLTQKDLPAAAISYTRKVTVCWCVFFLFNASVALYTVFFTSFKTWTLYNGLISYFIMGAIFVIEWLIRQRVKAKAIKAHSLNFSKFLTQLKDNSQRIIVKKENSEINGAKFLEDVTKLAAQINETPYQRWALYYEDVYQFCVALVAVLSCDRQPVLLHNTLVNTAESFRHEYDACLGDIEALDTTKLPAVQSNQEKSYRLNTQFDEQLNIIMFTSGSSGKPKKISRPLQKFCREITTLNEAFAAEVENACFYSTVSHQHLYGFTFAVLWPLLSGRTLIAETIQYPMQLKTVFQSNSNVSLITSPAFLKRLDYKPSHSGNNLAIFSAGGILPKESIENTMSHLNQCPIDIFGSTETGIIAYKKPATTPYWQAFPAVNISANKEGCLAIQSPFSSEDEHSTLTTGDRIMLHEKNQFEFLGRADRVVKIEDKRISLCDIERQLQKHPYVTEVCSLKLEDTRQYIAVIIQLTDQGKKALQEKGKHALNQKLKAFLSADYERILLPRRFRYVETIPTNSQNKRSTLDLAELFQ